MSPNPNRGFGDYECVPESLGPEMDRRKRLSRRAGGGPREGRDVEERSSSVDEENRGVAS